MYCLHPLLVKKYAERSDGTKQKTNSMQYVPCGSCIACLTRKRNEWTYRLTKENSCASYSLFLTLTYDDKNVPIQVVNNKPYYVFDKLQVQRYLKRCRHFVTSLGLNFRYFLVSEYGSKTHRPHYHMLLFVQNDNEVKYLKQIKDIFQSEWSFGMYNIQPISAANIHYCTKYCLKGINKIPDDCIMPCFTLSSRHPYIGAGVEDTLELQSDISSGEPVVFLNGYRQAMPRIYRQKLGVRSLHGEENNFDLRLSDNQFSRLCESMKDYSYVDAALEINRRLKVLEELCIERQNTRNEKL